MRHHKESKLTIFNFIHNVGIISNKVERAKPRMFRLIMNLQKINRDIPTKVEQVSNFTLFRLLFYLCKENYEQKKKQIVESFNSILECLQESLCYQSVIDGGKCKDESLTIHAIVMLMQNIYSHQSKEILQNLRTFVMLLEFLNRVEDDYGL